MASRCAINASKARFSRIGPIVSKSTPSSSPIALRSPGQRRVVRRFGMGWFSRTGRPIPPSWIEAPGARSAGYSSRSTASTNAPITPPGTLTMCSDPGKRPSWTSAMNSLNPATRSACISSFILYRRRYCLECRG